MNARLPLALLVGICSGAALLSARTAGGAEPALIDQGFIRDYCTSCHNGVSKKGRLDLASLWPGAPVTALGPALVTTTV